MQGSQGHKIIQEIGKNSGGPCFNLLVKSGSAMKSEQVFQGFINVMQGARDGQCDTKPSFPSSVRRLDKSQSVEKF